MKFTFEIRENDVLNSQLFTASKLSRKNHHVLLTAIAAVMTIVFYLSQDFVNALVACLTTIFFALFYSKVVRWRHKKLYEKIAKKSYSELSDHTIEIELGEEVILMKNCIGETKLNVSTISQVYEIQKYYFIRISPVSTLMIPKRAVDDEQGLKDKFASLNLPVNTDLDWQWR